MKLFKEIKDVDKIFNSIKPIKNIYGQFKDLKDAAVLEGATSFEAFKMALSSFNPVALGVGVTLGIVALSIAKVTNEYKKQKKEADNAIKEYQNTKSELENVNSELETTQARLAELEQKKGALSFVEQEEYDRLSKYNQQLLTQKGILEQLAQMQQYQAARESSEYVNTKRLYKNYDNNLDAEAYTPINGTLLEEIEYYQKEYEKRLQEIDKLSNKTYDEKDLSINDGKIFKGQQTKDQKTKERLEKERDELQGLITQNALQLNDYYKTYFDEYGNVVEGFEEEANKIEYIFELIKTPDQKAKDIDKAMQDIVSSTEDNLNKYNSLVEKAKENRENGGITLEDLQSKDYVELVKSFTNGIKDGITGEHFTEEDLVVKVNAEAEILNPKELRYQLNRSIESSLMEGKTSKTYDVNGEEIELTYIPRISTDGESEKLDQNTVDKYIETLLKNATDKNGKLSMSELIELDKKGLSVDGKEIYNILFNNVVGGFSENFAKIDEIFEQLSIDEKDKLVDYFAQNSDWLNWDIEDIEVNINNVVTGQDDLAKEIYSIEELSEATNSVVENINKVNEVLNQQSTGKSISYEAYNSDELKEYTSALEYNNGVLTLNEAKVRKLQKAKSEELIKTNDVTKALKQKEYINNAKQIEKLRKELNLSDSERKRSKDSILAEIDALNNSNSSIITQCQQLDLLNKNLREATGSYQAWLDAQNTSESGDMADDIRSAMQAVEDVWDSKSDSYGRLGTKKYQAAVELLVPDEISSQGAESVKKYVDNLKRYFTDGYEGAGNFLADALNKGLIEQLDNGSYKIAENKTMNDFKEAFNWTAEDVQAMFGELQEFYGTDKFHWSDETITSFGDGIMACSSSVEELQTELDSLNAKKIEQTGEEAENTQAEIEAITAKLEEVKQTKEELSNESLANIRANIDIDKQIEKAKRDIEGWKTSLEKNPGDVTIQANIDEAEQRLSELEQKKTNLQEPTEIELQLAVNDIDSRIEEITQKIKNLNDAQYLSDYNINTEQAQAEIQSLQTELDTLKAEKVEIQAESNSQEIIDSLDNINDYTIDNKKFSVSAIDNATKTINDIKNALGNLPITKTIKVQTNYVTKGNPPSGGNEGVNDVNGTAHAYGTAMASGNWGTDTTEKTLVGELG